MLNESYDYLFMKLISLNIYYSQHTLDGDEVKFGRVELHSTHMEYFSVANTNPVEIRLKSWGSNTSYAHVDLVGMQRGQKEDLVKIQDFDSLKKSVRETCTVSTMWLPPQVLR